MKLKHGIVYSASSGNLSGAIVAGGKNGSVLYTRTRKKFMMSDAATNHKVFFKRVSQAWRVVNPSIRLKWNAVSSNFYRMNKYGSSVPYTGFQLFFRFNYFRLLSGFGLSNLVPTGTYNETALPCSVVCSSSMSSMYHFYSRVASVNFRAVIFASPVFKSESMFRESSLKYIVTSTCFSVSPRNILSFYRAVFSDTFVSGHFIFFKFAFFDVSGQPFYPTQTFCCKIS